MGRQKKRVNPRRQLTRPQQALKTGRDQGIDGAMAIMFTALLDGGFIPKEQIPELWKRVQYISDSIAKGYVNLHDMIRALADEHDIILR